MKKILSLLTLLLCSIACVMAAPAEKIYKVTSPDGSLKVEVKLNHQISYSVYSGDNLLLDDCTLSLKLANDEVGFSPRVKKAKTSLVDETVKRPIAMKNAEVYSLSNT